MDVVLLSYGLSAFMCKSLHQAKPVQPPIDSSELHHLYVDTDHSLIVKLCMNMMQTKLLKVVLLHFMKRREETWKVVVPKEVTVPLPPSLSHAVCSGPTPLLAECSELSFCKHRGAANQQARLPDLWIGSFQWTNVCSIEGLGSLYHVQDSTSLYDLPQLRHSLWTSKLEQILTVWPQSVNWI